MAEDNIREIISSTVRDALSRRAVSTVVQSSQPEESEQNRGKKRKAKIPWHLANSLHLLVYPLSATAPEHQPWLYRWPWLWLRHVQRKNGYGSSNHCWLWPAVNNSLYKHFFDLYVGLQSIVSSIVFWQYKTPGIPRTYIGHTYIHMKRLLLWLSFVNTTSL